MKSVLVRFVSVAMFSYIASFASVASAQSTWNLGGACDPSTTTGQNTATCIVNGVTATMTVYGGSSSSNFVQGTIGDYDPSGFGATTGANETSYNAQHAFDNATAGCSSTSGQTACGAQTEALLIGFGSAKVDLTSLAVGFVSGDSDVSVLRWDGTSGSPVLASNPNRLTNINVGGLGAAGWTLVASKDVDYQGVAFDNPNNTALTAYKVGIDSADDKVSSWWLISTYYGSSSSPLEMGDERFKLLNFVAKVCASPGSNGSCNRVAEPGSIALVAVSLMGFVFSRRRVLVSRRLRTAAAC